MKQVEFQRFQNFEIFMHSHTHGKASGSFTKERVEELRKTRCIHTSKFEGRKTRRKVTLTYLTQACNFHQK